MAADDLREPVLAALAGVVDPCSRFMGSNLGFSELGMIDSVEASADGDVSITLLLDDPTCLYMVEIERSLRLAAEAVPGVRSATVSVRWDELWTEERASPEAQRVLLRKRQPQLLTIRRSKEGT